MAQRPKKYRFQEPSSEAFFSSFFFAVNVTLGWRRQKLYARMATYLSKLHYTSILSKKNTKHLYWGKGPLTYCLFRDFQHVNIADIARNAPDPIQGVIIRGREGEGEGY